MDRMSLQERADRCAMKLPGAELDDPFGPDWGVYKVAGKVFMLQTSITGQAIVILKSHPEEASALREEHSDITPGYHMDKRHWITLHPDGPLTGPEVDELVTESYRLVVENLPKADRPVDPAELAPRV